MSNPESDIQVYSVPDQHPELTENEQPTRSSAQKQEVNLRARVQDSWILETVSVGFSDASFIAICAVLIAYNSKPRPALVHDLELNAIISVLATACKSCLTLAVAEAISQLKWVSLQSEKYKKLVSIQAYDDASRGPLGSLMLLISQRCRSLVSLGAGILVLLLAFEPFLQQVISYPNRLTDSGDSGGIATAMQSRTGLAHEKRFGNMVSANGRGIWTNNFDVRPRCSTGNCTWPVFPSLGYCSKCVDMTSSARLNCREPLSREGDTAEGLCEVILPKGRSSNTTVRLEFEQGRVQSVWLPKDVIWTVNRPHVRDPPLGDTYAGVQKPLLVLAHANLTLDDHRIRYPHNPLGGIDIGNVTVCSLSFCLRHCNVSVNGGEPSVHTISKDFGHVFVHELHSESGGALSQGCWMPGNDSRAVTIYKELFSGSIAWVNTSEFAICDYHHQHESEYDFVGQRLRWYRLDAQGWTERGGSSGGPNFEHIITLGIEVAMSHVAAALTQAAIETSNYTVRGTAYTSEVYVQVQWAWLILPALLIIAGNGFVLLTIRANKSRRVALWKSSTLALLFHGMEQVSRDEQGYGTISRMESMAGTVDVRLQPSSVDGRWVLRKAR
ncbi:hypothetical protein BDV18DRAFT_161022 [Aspergillus unguis]